MLARVPKAKRVRSPAEEREALRQAGKCVCRRPDALTTGAVEAGWPDRRKTKEASWARLAPLMACTALARLDPALLGHAYAALAARGWHPTPLQRRCGVQPPGCLVIDLGLLCRWVAQLEAAVRNAAAEERSAHLASVRDRTLAERERLQKLDRPALQARADKPVAARAPGLRPRRRGGAPAGGETGASALPGATTGAPAPASGSATGAAPGKQPLARCANACSADHTAT